jgi:uncharacterized membrane protein HdeD (DUF308 family)
MVDRTLLRLSASLLLIGVLVSVVADMLHPPGANDYRAAFTAYANSSMWTAVHLAQFVGMALILAGLLLLFFALGLSEGIPHWLGFFGAVSAGVALALAGVAYAVDGVALKQAVDAWASASAAEKATRFADADTLRWLEIGTSSYLAFMMGLALVLLGIAIVWTARVPRPIGILMGLSGLAYFVQGWLFGTTGFTSATTLPTNAAYTLLFVSMVWLLIVAWLRKALAQSAPQVGRPRADPS